MKWPSLKLWCVVCIVVGGSQRGNGDGVSPQELKSVGALVAARQESLGRVAVTFEVDELFTPFKELQQRAAKQRKPTVVLLAGLRRGSGSFRCCDGFGYFEWRPDADVVGDSSASVPSVRYTVQSFTGSRVEHLYRQPSDSWDIGKISMPMGLPEKSVIDVALGLRAWDDSKWIASGAWRTLAVDAQADGAVTLSSRPLDKDGQSKRLDVWTFAPTQGYAIISYDFVYDGRTVVTIRASDFKTVDTLQLPFRVEQKLFAYRGNDRNGEVVETRNLRVKTYSLNDPANNPSSYNLTYPAHAAVVDERTGRQFRIGDYPQTLDDDALRLGIVGGGPTLPVEGASAASGRRAWVIGANCVALAMVIGLLIARSRRGRA